MNILAYIVYLGILNIVFGFVWKWVFVLPCVFLCALLRINKVMYFVKGFGVYLLVSLTALLTLGTIHDNPGIFSVIFYPLLGTFILYMGVAQDTYEGQKQAYMTADYELLENLKYDCLFIIGAPVLFVVMLFVPVIGYNLLTVWLMSVVAWAYNLPIIGWLLGLGGVLFLLSLIWYGFIFSMMLFGAIMSKTKGEPPAGKKVRQEEIVDIEADKVEDAKKDVGEIDEEQPNY